MTHDEALTAGDEVQLRIELAEDGTGHSLYAEHEPRRAIVMTPKPDTLHKSGHILLVPLTDEEVSNWHEVHKHEADGETCIKVTNVKQQHLA